MEFLSVRLTKFYQATRGACFYVTSHAPQLKGAGARRIRILGYSHTTAHSIWPRTTKFGVVINVGRLCF